jgi:hypothetical protein
MWDNLLGVLLAWSLGSIEVHDSVAVITVVATTVIIVSALGFLIKGLLVVVVVANDGAIPLVELDGLVL